MITDKDCMRAMDAVVPDLILRIQKLAGKELSPSERRRIIGQWAFQLALDMMFGGDLPLEEIRATFERALVGRAEEGVADHD